MILTWSRKPKIVTEVAGDEIIVTMPGTSFSVVYEKLNGVQLIAKSFTSQRNSESKKSKITFPQFLASAWKLANDKARELGWIV